RSRSTRSGDAGDLVRLEAQPPARGVAAIGDRLREVRGQVRAVQRLEVEDLEVQDTDALGRDAVRVHELELVAAPHDQLRARLGADREPVDAARGRDGSVRLDGRLEAALAAGRQERPVELEERLAAGEDDVRSRAGVRSRAVAPGARDRVGELPGLLEAAAA